MEAFYSFVFAGIMFVMFHFLYRRLLQRSPYFTINRLFLLLIPVFAVLTVNIKVPVADIVNTALIELPYFIVERGENEIPAAPEASISLLSVLYFVYAAGMIFFLLKLFVSAYRNVLFILEAKKVTLHGINCRYHKSAQSTYNFLGVIVVHKLDVSQKIVEHESAHSRLFHYIDLIWAELWCCVFWFVPFAHLYVYNVELNNEFAADDEAAGSDRKNYIKELAAAALNVSAKVFTQSFFNKSLIQNRITMLQSKKRNPFLTVLRYGAAGVLFAVGIYGFNTVAQVSGHSTQKSTTEDTEPEIYDKVENMPKFKGGQSALFEYLQEHIVFPEDAKKAGFTEEIVYVSFVISNRGKVTRIEVMRGDEIFHESAVNALADMPDWEPGSTKEGDAVPVQFMLPLKYRLKAEDAEE